MTLDQEVSDDESEDSVDEDENDGVIGTDEASETCDL